MNKETIITTILAVLSGALIVGAIVGITLKDRTAPVISLEGSNNFTYTQGDTEDTLLEDVTAKDNKDGDVTDTLRVSNIYITSEDRAVILYVAKDQANNVGKLKREVRYQEKRPEEVTKETKSEGTETDSTENKEEAAANALASGPKLVLLENEATVKKGETFNVFKYIAGAVDENGKDISKNVHVEGTYDLNTLGTYDLKIYAANAKGVHSNTENFKLTVE